MKVTFFGPKVDKYQIPKPYHVYDVVELPAPWSGPKAFIALIKELNECPMPSKQHYLMSPANPGDAFNTAVDVLKGLPENDGLGVTFD